MSEEVVTQAAEPENIAVPEDASGETDSPVSAAGENEPDKPEGEPQKPHKGGFQRRIDKLTREKSEAEQKAEYWRTQALRTEPEKKSETAPPQAEGKPNPANFETQAEYLESLADWKVEQREKAREAKQQEESQRTQQQKALESYAEREKAFSVGKEDYDDVIQGAIADENPAFTSPAIASALVDYEYGPAAVYYLAQNPDEAARLAKLSPTQIAREIGRLESKFAPSADTETQKNATPAPVTKAPKPPTPVKQPTRTAEKDPDEMSPEEWRQYRAKQFPHLR
jgi:hypothetical protein